MVESSSLPALRLDPLVGENAAAMLEALLGDGADLDSLKRLVTDRTGGNSFFIKEMVQSLFERRILARSGTVKVVRPLLQAHLLVTSKVCSRLVLIVSRPATGICCIQSPCSVASFSSD